MNPHLPITTTMDDLSQIPVVPPPDGITSNFINPPTLMTGVIVGTVLIQVVALPLILARAAVNVMTRTIHLEDYFCYTAYIAMITHAALLIHGSSIGGARHAWDISLLQMGAVNRFYNYILIAWNISGYFGRTYILLQLKRLFTTKGHKGAVYWVIVASIVGNTMLYTAFLFAYIFQCVPRRMFWDPEATGRCVDEVQLQRATGALNIVSDVEILLVPLWAVWMLKMRLEHKIRVFAVFSVGVV